jgi:endonuclease/exonuclease/phosphatase family metal-dependent hydrolase
MTRNLYFGADLEPVLGATTPEDFLAALLGAFAQAQGSNFPLRMDAVAGEIADSGAVLVGMQEVATWSVDGVVVADFTELVIQGLADRGLRYEAVAVAPGFQFAAPIPGVGTAGLAISDVILARTDLSPSELKLRNAQTGNYVAQVVLSTPLGQLPFPRQWAAIDAKVRGKQFRFVSTHLESLDQGPYAGIRQAQADELLTSPTSPLNTTRQPVVLVGDFNSEVTDAGDAVDLFLSAGFTDAWAAAGTGPGYTFGHDPDLAEPSDGLDDSRIDFVTVRGTPVVEGVSVVDTSLDPSPADRPLWPSDHGGLVATLELKPR